MNILALDVGTSSMRGILFDETGSPSLTHRVLYTPTSIDHTHVEQDPTSWTSAVTEICRAIAAQQHVDALTLTSQRSSVMAVDERGHALAPAIMWQDTRNAALVGVLSAHADLIYRRSGSRPNTVYSGPKMAWIRRHEPDLYERAFKLCTIADLLCCHMTGELVTDTTYASRSLLMDLATGQWDEQLLEVMGIDREKLCPILPAGSVAGTVSASFAGATGLTEGIPLVSAGGDQQCGALGQGVVGSGRIAATFGTGAFLLEQVDEIPEEMHGELICGAHALPGTYTLESSMLTCGALFDWCRRILFPEGLEVMNNAVAASPVGAGGVSALPFFQGRGTPDWNSAAHGAFAGLSLSTTRGDLARAALEAIALEAANHVELLEAQGGRAAAICVGGGLTNQPLFPQMLADASGRTVLREQGAVEGTARGAWMSAAVTLGLVSDFEEAFTVAASRSAYDPYKPNEATAVRYQELRTRMNELYLQTK